MSCQDCVFQHQLNRGPFAIPCNSCEDNKEDKGYCLASDSRFGYVPTLTRIFDFELAQSLIQRARSQGTELRLFLWSREKNAYCHTDC